MKVDMPYNTTNQHNLKKKILHKVTQQDKKEKTLSISL